MIIWRESLFALIYSGDWVTWKVLAEYSWNPTTTLSSSFLCTVASSMPIRIVTKEVKYIYELSLTLEHSMSVSSPTAPGLTAAPVAGRTCRLFGRGRRGRQEGKPRREGRDGDKNPGRSLPGKGIRGELPREALLELKAPSEGIPKERQEERKTSSR